MNKESPEHDITRDENTFIRLEKQKNYYIKLQKNYYSLSHVTNLWKIYSL